MSPGFRVGLAAFALCVVGVMFATNYFLTQRFTNAQRIDSQYHATLYSSGLVTLLRQQSLVPLLLARDPILITALRTKDFTNTSARLIEVTEDIREAPITLVDIDGRVVAASDRNTLGSSLADQPYVTNALRETRTAFTVTGGDAANTLGVFYSRKVEDGDEILGAIVVQVPLRELENTWRTRNDMVTVTDTSDQVILSSQPRWRTQELSTILAAQPPPSAVQRALTPRREAIQAEPFVFLDGQAMLRTEVRTGFRGWRLTYFSTLTGVRARVNGILALEAMVFASLAAVALFLANKRLERQSRAMAEESDELRRLNARLSQEIEERERVERDLQTAEQSLEQASKLAAIGQMSAAVSHELNQPLAAMRTYLAGARLLLQRSRTDEALSSFHRIDDLIERMGTITRQMKSYARKGGNDLREVDLRDAVDGSLSMMAPQLGQTRVEVRKSLPREPVIVRADPIRLDQIIVNLLRNALDAVKDADNPVVDILVVQGQQVLLRVRDNGHGIEDPDALFEPFYTTKKPGEGVGLGLAISAGIAKELGGRLLAKNAEPAGAIFELQLPRAMAAAPQAAE
ncbi:MAG: ATP-binding protein [Pseudomonadota bacterium]